VALDGGAAGSEDTTKVEVEWSADGVATRALRLTHAGEVRLTREDIAAVELRLRRLAEAAEDERSASQLTGGSAP
jgi:hypothetical protein